MVESSTWWSLQRGGVFNVVESSQEGARWPRQDPFSEYLLWAVPKRQLEIPIPVVLLGYGHL